LKLGPYRKPPRKQTRLLATGGTRGGSGSVSPLEEFATEISAVIAKHPDLTVLETIAELRKRRIRTSRSSLWR
jgi:hypothetical protein